MRKGTRFALLLGAVPFLMLVFALPFVNRTEPVILGFPFVMKKNRAGVFIVLTFRKKKAAASLPKMVK